MNKKLVGAAVAGAAILAVVAAQFLTGGEEPAAAPPATSAPAPATTPPPGRLSTENYDFPDAAGGRGWSIHIPVPSGWLVTHDRKEHASYRRGDLLLETDRVPIEQEDALSGLQAIADAAHHGDSVVKPTTTGDVQDSAEWDYTYLRDGTPERVTVLGIGAGDSLVTIRYEAPAAEFERNRGVLEAARNVSAPG